MSTLSTQQPGQHPVHALLERLSGEPQVDIRFDFEDQESWAAITEFDDNDNQTSLRYYGGNRYAWVKGAYDESDDFIEEMEWLSAEVVSLLPDGCRRLLEKVRDDEKGMRLAGHFLLQQKG
ncbi:MAG: hypothetical protein ACKOOA_03140 [Sediminibacterium sp.]